MREDQNDDLAFRHPRERYEGYNMDTEYQQFVPHFFTPDRAPVALEGLYKKCSIFLICNGPSFVTLNHDLLRKPGILTFGINNGPKTFRPNFWTCVDDPSRFIKSIWLDPKIQKFIPQAHFDKKIFDSQNGQWKELDIRVRDCPNVLGYMRNEKFNAQRFLTETSFNWGNHKDYGGGRSVMLPAIRIIYVLGFRTVYLLGCDMKMSETYTYHFDEQRTKGAVNCNMGTYDRLKNEYFPQLKPIFDKVGFKVFNCNPNSELRCFPFISFEEAIEEASKNIGDVESERTYGLYSSPDEKDAYKNDADPTNKVHLITLEKLKSGQPVEVVIPDKFKKKEEERQRQRIQTQSQIEHLPQTQSQQGNITVSHFMPLVPSSIPSSASSPMPSPMPFNSSAQQVCPSGKPSETKPVINHTLQPEIPIMGKSSNIVKPELEFKKNIPLNMQSPETIVMSNIPVTISSNLTVKKIDLTMDNIKIE